MSNKIALSILVIFLALLSDGNCSSPEEPAVHKEFSGLQGGFFNHPPPVKPSSVVLHGPAAPPKLSIWDDPALKTPEARECIYDFLRVSLDQFNSRDEDLFSDVRDYFRTLESADIPAREASLTSARILDYIRLRGYVFSQCNQDMLGGYDARLIPNLLRTIASMDDQVLSAKFDFIQQLPEDQGKEILEKFTEPDSNYEQGRLQCDYPLGYFSEHHPSGKKCYRIYAISKSIQLPSPSFSCYSRAYKGIAGYASWPTDDFILNKQRELVETSGIVIAHMLRINQFFIYAYKKDKTENRMRLLPSGDFEKEDIKEFPLLEKLVSFAGGLERINREQLVLIPEPGSAEHPDMDVKDAEILLPYALRLQSSLDPQETIIDVPLLTYAIKKMEQTIIDSPSSQSLLPFLGEQVAQELANVQIEEELARQDEVLLGKIKEESATILKALVPSRKKTKLGKQARQEARKAAIEKIKADRAKEQEPSIVQQTAKEKLVEKIRRKYANKATEKSHFSSREARALLNDMTKAFSREGLVTATGASRVRGSHEGKEVALSDGSSATMLGIARRPEAKGYKAGTIKTIVNGHVNKVIALLRRSYNGGLES